MQVLLINGDHYTPLAILDWKKAFELIYNDKVKVIAEYDNEIHSAHKTYKVPSVIALKKYVHFNRKIKYSKYNVYARDNYTCQYCHQELSRNCEMTLDHVLPRSQGGKTSWENTVLACRKCNFDKGGRTPKQAKMKLAKEPIHPSHLDFAVLTFKNKSIPEAWLSYYK